MARMTRDCWIVLGLVGVLVGATVALVFRPQGRQLDELRTQIATRQNVLESDAQKVAVVPEMLRQVQEMKQRYRDFDRKLPKRKELGGFLREISGNLSEERLANQLIEPGNPSREELFNTLPIVMKFRGSYLSLASFLKRLDEMQRLSRVEKLKIDCNAKDDSAALDIEVLLDIYFTES
jgi:Tfp pilus assembly protein PilO